MSRIRANTITNQNANGAPNFPDGITVSGVVTATTTNQNITGDLTVTGNIGVGGTITYEDVTNVDSVGIITVRAGVNVVGNDLNVGSNIKIGINDSFIMNAPGVEFKPLDFSNLDLKFIWYSNKSNKIIKKYILNILSHTYEIGYNTYKLITSPNIDIREFSNIVVKSIESLKHKIPGCSNAFKIISNSVGTLEGNFDLLNLDKGLK